MLFAARPYSDSLAIGDVNSDGKPDVITTGNDGISVLLNDGHGRFKQRRDYAIGTDVDAHSVAIGDLNADEKPDVVTANTASSTVSILLNRGGGTYRSHVEYRTGRDPEEVEIADLDADGKLDLITANYLGNTVSTIRGRGDGTFDPKVSHETARGPVSLAVSDLNGDGAPDIAVAARLADYVSVLLNRGKGTFHARVNYRVRGPRSIAVGDVDGDRKIDLVTANINNEASALVNDGDGSFPRRLDFDLYSATSVAVGEVTGDRKSELVFDPADTCSTANDRPVDCIALLVGTGGGRFQPSLFYFDGLIATWSGRPRTLAIRDLNGDGRADVVVTGQTRSGTSASGLAVLLARRASRHCVVPDLYGRTVAEAKLALSHAGCRLGTIGPGLREPGIPSGRVVDSLPQSNTVLPEGSRVALDLNPA
jgi:hypothetical protein